MTNNNQHSSEENFRRYINNEMTDSERFAFEKALQNDAFANEALEGFELAGAGFPEHEIGQLKKQFTNKQKRNLYRFLAAAASVLLLITAGVLWNYIDSKNEIPKLVENTQKTEEKTVPVFSEKQKENLYISEDTSISDQAQIPETKQQISTAQKLMAPPLQSETSDQMSSEQVSIVAEVEQEMEETEILQATPEKAATPKSREIRIRGISAAPKYDVGSVAAIDSTNTTWIKGKVISADDKQVLSGVLLLEKGTTNFTTSDKNGNFKLPLPDSGATIIAHVSGSEMNEVPVADDSSVLVQLKASEEKQSVEKQFLSEIYKKKTQEVKAVKNIKNRAAQPLSGMDEFKNYLTENALLPPHYKKKRVRVKLGFTVDIAGYLSDFKNLNNADSVLYKKAVSLVTDGPAWLPEFENGKPVPSQQQIRIVFRISNKD